MGRGRLLDREIGFIQNWVVKGAVMQMGFC